MEEFLCKLDVTLTGEYKKRPSENGHKHTNPWSKRRKRNMDTRPFCLMNIIYQSVVMFAERNVQRTSDIEQFRGINQEVI
mgnify:CR=1 FL=1